MTTVGTRQYIHYDPDRVDFAVTPEELERLRRSGGDLWKDVCLVALSLGVSCLINAIAATPEPFKLSLALFLNYLFGIVGILLGIAFGIAWKRSGETVEQIVCAIKRKPKLEIALPGVVNVGALPSAALSPASEPAEEASASRA